MHNTHNGDCSNGLSKQKEKAAALASPEGLDKRELVRVMIQALNSLGYSGSAQHLEKESKIALERSEVTQFRTCLLEGKFDEAISLLPFLNLIDEEKLKSVKFLIYRQKFLEQLEQKQTKEALITLRQQLSPVNRDANNLHKLTSLLMCMRLEDLRKRANWDGSGANSRLELLNDLHKYISPSVFIPENRLENLLINGVKYNRLNSCTIYSPNGPISLFDEDIDPETLLPVDCASIVSDHRDEVWFVQFSHNGRHMATASKDSTAIVYDITRDQNGVVQFENKRILKGHSDSISFVAFSYDDTMLLTCSNDKLARLWDVESGKCTKTLSKHKDSVTSCTWFTNNIHFITASLDRNLYKWNVDGSLISSWNLNLRVHDVAISSDSKKLVLLGHEKKIYVYNPENKEDFYTLNDGDSMTSLSLSHDGRSLLVNVSKGDEQGEIHLWDMEERRLLHKYSGNKQTRYVVRSCLGGYFSEDPFVFSGSEDHSVYVWQKLNSKFLGQLKGHTSTVNSVSWNSAFNILASASDDRTVRIWSRIDRVKDITPGKNDQKA